MTVPGTGSRPVRLGFQTHLHGSEPAAELYPAVVDLFVAAEELGFDSGWVAQHHFAPREGRLPSPLPFLASVAARTSRIGLGTSVVALPLEDPVRVAEDASVVDALSGGRLQLGLGSGNPKPDQFAAFGRDPAERHARYDRGVARLLAALRGDELAPGVRLEPPAPGLADRVWESPLAQERVVAAAERGSGILLGIGPGATVQLALARAHVAAAARVGAVPRVALVQAAFFGPDAASVRAELAPDLRRDTLGYLAAAGWTDADPTDEALLRALNLHHGTGADVVRSVLAEPALALATDLVLAVQAHSTTIDRAIRALEALAAELRDQDGDLSVRRPVGTRRSSRT